MLPCNIWVFCGDTTFELLVIEHRSLKSETVSYGSCSHFTKRDGEKFTHSTS